MWFGLFSVLVLILVVWWLLTRNAAQSQKEVSATVKEEEHHSGTTTREISVTTKAEEPTLEDDLTLIEGIGPKINRILKEAKILTFDQLAEMKPDEIKEILSSAGIRLGDPTSWPEQARLAAEGKLEELKRLQESLKGGRAVKD